MTYATARIEKEFPFAELEGSEDEIKLGHKIRLAYVSWQLNLSSPYIQLSDIKQTEAAYWITNYAWILQN